MLSGKAIGVSGTLVCQDQSTVLPLEDAVPRGTRGSSVSAIAPQFHSKQNGLFKPKGWPERDESACGLLGGAGVFL